MAKNNASQTQKNGQFMLRNIIDQAISGAARDAAEVAKYKPAPARYGQLVARALQTVQQSEHFGALSPDEVKERARTTFANTLKQVTDKTEHRAQILQAFDRVVSQRNLIPLNQSVEPTLRPIVHVSRNVGDETAEPLEPIADLDVDSSSRIAGSNSPNNWSVDGAFAPASLSATPLPDIRPLARRLNIKPDELMRLITRVDITTPAGVTALARTAGVSVAQIQKQLDSPETRKLLAGPNGVRALLTDQRKPIRLQNQQGSGVIVLPSTELLYDPTRPLSPEEYVLIAMEHPDVKEAIARRMGVKPADLTFQMQEGRLKMDEVMPHFIALAKEVKEGKPAAEKTGLSPVTTNLLNAEYDLVTSQQAERMVRRDAKQNAQRNGLPSSGQIFNLGSDPILESSDFLNKRRKEIDLGKKPGKNARQTQSDSSAQILDFPLVRRVDDSLVRIPKRSTKPVDILDTDFEDITPNADARRGPPPLPTRTTNEETATLNPGSRKGLFDSKIWNTYNNHTWKENQTTRSYGSTLRNVLYHSMLTHEDERTREKFGSLNEKAQTKLLDDAVENIFRSNQTLARAARTGKQRTWHSNAAMPSADGTQVTPLGVLAAAQLFPDFSQFEEASRNLLNVSRTNETQRNALKVMHEAVQLTHAPNFEREEDTIYGKDSYRSEPVSHRLQASRAMNGLSRATNAILRKQTQTGLPLRDIKLAELPRAGRERRTA